MVTGFGRRRKGVVICIVLSIEYLLRIGLEVNRICFDRRMRGLWDGRRSLVHDTSDCESDNDKIPFYKSI